MSWPSAPHLPSHQGCLLFRPCIIAFLFLSASAFVGGLVRAENQGVLPPLGYVVKSWQVEDGLPQSSITAMGQTPDGYLWLGTFGALARFDGVHFKVFDPSNTPALGNCRVLLMVVDPHGWLWVLSEGNDLTRMANGVFERVNGRLGLPNLGIINLGMDPAGVVWVISEKSGYYRFQERSFVARAPVMSILPSQIPSVKMTEARQLWLPGELGWDWTGITALRQALNIQDAAPRFHRGRNDDLWMFADGQFRNMRTGRMVRPSPFIDPRADIHDGAEDRLGNIWVGTWHKGLFVIPPSGALAHIPLGQATGDESVRGLFVDAEDNVWLGMNSGGLVQVARQDFSTLGKGQGLRDAVIKSVQEDRDGQMWVLHGAGVDWIMPDGSVQKKWARGGFWSSAQTPDGRIWLGNYGGALQRYEDGSLLECQMEKGLTHVMALASDRMGGLWVGTPGGLGKLSGTSVQVVPLPDHLAQRDVRAIADDTDGHLYVGLNGGGLLRRTGERWEQFSKVQGLADDHVKSLLVETNGVVWLGTAVGGLSRFQNGRFFNFSPADFPLPSLVSCIAEDDWGNFWLGSTTGIYRVRRSELEEVITAGRRTLPVRRYGKPDGLGTSECAGGMQPTWCKARDGRLWFATINGLSVVDPANLGWNGRPPPVVIEQVLIDEKPGGDLRSEAQANQPFAQLKKADTPPRILQVDPGNRRLAIHYTGLSFRSPENVRFKYRLDGLDDDWTEAGARRIAYYQGLRPGHYRFRVIAGNNDGVWNETGASLSMVVLPYLYQTWWFRALVVCSFIGLLAVAYRRRIHRLEEGRAAQQAFSRQLIERQDSERKRIAAELHDSLGQDLLVIKNRALLGLAPGRPNSGEHLDEISRTASQALQQVRKIAYNLRPYQLDRLGLTEAIDALVEKISAAGPVKIEAEIDPVDKLFQPQDENHIFRILQEALNNTVKHSGATGATVRVHRTGDELRMTITDNGSGFEPAYTRPLAKSGGSLGLSNMSERAGILQGVFQVSSSRGHGTTVTVVIPLAKNSHEEEDPHPPGG